MSDHQSVILTAPVDAASREESPPLIFGLEEAILGTLLIEGRIPEGIREQLSPDIFSERWRPIARAILSVAEGSGACDVVSVYHELEHGNRMGIRSLRPIIALAG